MHSPQSRCPHVTIRQPFGGFPSIAVPVFAQWEHSTFSSFGGYIFRLMGKFYRSSAVPFGCLPSMARAWGRQMWHRSRFRFVGPNGASRVSRKVAFRFTPSSSQKPQTDLPRMARSILNRLFMAGMGRYQPTNPAEHFLE